MRSTRRLQPTTTDAQTLVRRARRLRRRGEHRRAMLMLREACYRDDSDALLWTLYAVQCMKVGRRDDAAQALKQAVWLRARDRDEPRARVTRALLAHVLAGNDSFRIAA